MTGTVSLPTGSHPFGSYCWVIQPSHPSDVVSVSREAPRVVFVGKRRPLQESQGVAAGVSGLCHLKLGSSSCWHMQDTGLGAVVVGELVDPFAELLLPLVRADTEWTILG